MRERYVLSIAVGARGESPAATTAPGARRPTGPHTWITAPHGREWLWCAIREGWPGARRGCPNGQARRSAEAEDASSRPIRRAG